MLIHRDDALGMDGLREILGTMALEFDQRMPLARWDDGDTKSYMITRDDAPAARSPAFDRHSSLCQMARTSLLGRASANDRSRTTVPPEIVPASDGKRRRNLERAPAAMGRQRGTALARLSVDLRSIRQHSIGENRPARQI